ncbi:alanine dehydrogenase [Aminipila terrae]|uniref:alanine dehydrogenase n=1 Tax=Aminipila terrae TaxID=2697030 RepID=A0A6P1MCC7_9FIRM|nr:alanine dehydrogenase [Aminipila terrae]QHI72300.1 alanine dehydrogenase [Aminipila terrae]
MIIGVPKEIKPNEYRVAATPAGVQTLTSRGHIVLVEKDAGIGSNMQNEEYEKAGAKIVSKDELFSQSEMIYKVKEFFPEEYKYLRENLIVFTYIHSNAHPEETDAFLNSKVIGISYEDIEEGKGNFPLLSPMSEFAGKGGFLAACHFSQKVHGGKGILLARIPGVQTPQITIIGAGAAGMGAAELAASFGNKVVILDIDLEKLKKAKEVLPSNIELLYSDQTNLLNALTNSDVIINCILWPKWRKDHLIDRKMLKLMKTNSLIVDVSCDDNGAIETCHSTSHDNPVYSEEGIMHYCVDNIPSAFSQAASVSLCNHSLPFTLEIADKGYETALKENPVLRKGLCFYTGSLTLKETALKQNRPYKTPEEVLGI